MEEYVKTLRNTTDSLANDNELLKFRVPLLENEIEELTSNLHQKTDELKRLQNAESQRMQPSTQFWKLQEDFTMLRNSNDSLVKENEFLNSRMPLLENEIEQLKSSLRQKESHFMCTSIEELESFLLASPTHSEEDAANNVHITQGPRSSQGGRMYTDELVHDFTRKLDAKDEPSGFFRLQWLDGGSGKKWDGHFTPFSGSY
ncbi:PREDICTED: uncharacterized protein LOC18606762 isoform X2 [Theobroma cacao]|uniref:Uncharacterized protein LOC18606762 isoform X2 n=1 Tax=Theobroma cacao TaxID=3641 RepID=A0AB32W578_THECC|nr:PREDICTED: uncharacterized protein LOC18606762 isoform X2 [Theobroma cacao]